MEKPATQRTHVLIPDNQIVQQAHPVSASIPATLVVKSDGSLAISSNAIDTQSNPIQLVMIPNAAGKKNIYMVPKKNNDLNQAFLVKPVDGQEWNVGKAQVQSVGSNVSIPNSSSNALKEVPAPNVLMMNDVSQNVNVKKEGDDVVNVSKTVTVTSSFQTPYYIPPILPLPCAPSAKERSFPAQTTPTVTATTNHSATESTIFVPSFTSNKVRALLQQKVAQQANQGPQQAISGLQQAIPRPRQSTPGPQQAICGLRQATLGMQQANRGPQQQQKAAGPQVRLKASKIPTLLSKLLLEQESATCKNAGEPEQHTIISQTTASTPLAGQTLTNIVNQVQSFTDTQQGNVCHGIETTQRSTIGPQPLVYIPTNNTTQQCQLSSDASYPALSQLLNQIPLAGSQPLQYLSLYNIQQVIQPQSIGVMQQNPSPFMTQGQTMANTTSLQGQTMANTTSLQGQTMANTTSLSGNSFVGSQTGISSKCSQLEVVLGSHNASANVAPLAQHLSAALANKSQIQYKFAFPVPPTSDSGNSLTKVVKTEPNTHDDPVIGGLQAAMGASSIESLEIKTEPEVLDATTGLNHASLGGSTICMINGQPYLVSVNQNNGVAALVTLASTKESFNTEPKSSGNASFTNVVSSKTPVMSTKASTQNNSKDNICINSMSKPPLSVSNVSNISGKPNPKPLSPINTTGFSVEQLMELNDIMLREHGRVLDKPLLDYINSYTKTLSDKQNSTVKKSRTRKKKSTTQNEGCSVSEKEISESITSKKSSDRDNSLPILQRRRAGGGIELDSSLSGQNGQSENKMKNTQCDNDLDAMIVDSDSSNENDVTTFYSDGTFTGPALIPPHSPVGPDEARPMLLFRSEIARKLKPAILRDSELSSSVNKTTSITSPMVFSITTSSSSIVTSCNSVTTRPVSTISFPSHATGTSLTTVSSSTVSSNVDKAAPILGNKNAGKRSLVIPIDVDPVPAQPHQKTRIPFKTIKMNKLIDLTMSNAVTSPLSPPVRSISNQDRQNGTAKDKTLVVETTDLCNTASLSKKGDSHVEIIYRETDSNSINKVDKIDSVDDINEPLTIKIDSVFSLNPKGLFNAKHGLGKTNNEKRTETHQVDEKRTETHLKDKDQNILGLDESDMEIIDYLEQQNGEDPDDVIIIDSVEDEDIDRTLNESSSKDEMEVILVKNRNKRLCKSTDHSCRVVLRCLNMKKFQSPYSFEFIQRALSQNMCTKTCRKMAVHKYFEKGAATSITRIPTCADKRFYRYIPYVKVSPKRLKSKDQKAMQTNTHLSPKSSDISLKKLKVVSNNASQPRVVTIGQHRKNLVNYAEKQQVPVQLKQKVQTSADTNICGCSPQEERIVITKALLDGSLEVSCSGRLVPPGSSQQALAAETTNACVVNTPSRLLNNPRAMITTSSSTLSIVSASSLSPTSEAESTTNGCKITTSTSLDNVFPTLAPSSKRIPASLGYITDPIEIQCASQPDKQFPGIMKEQNASHLGADAETNTDPVYVKSEPFNGKNYDESQISPVSGRWIVRKRKSLDEVSRSEESDNKDTVKNENKDVNALNTDESSHLERIKRLKEQLQQEQEALEKIRKQKFSKDSSSC